MLEFKDPVLLGLIINGFENLVKRVPRTSDELGLCLDMSDMSDQKLNQWWILHSVVSVWIK